MDSFYRYYLPQEINELEVDILTREIEKFEGVVLQASKNFIKDAAQRERYNVNVQRMSQEVLEQVHAGKMSVREAAEFCAEMRNKFMQETRARTSTVGLAFAENEKPKPRSFEALRDEKAVKAFGAKYDELSPKQQKTVYYEIIESSARPRASYNVLNERLRMLGKTFILATAAYVLYDIAMAEDKKRAVAEHGGALVGGYLGAGLASLVISPVCGPGAPICAVVVFLVVGGLGGWAGGEVAQYFYDEKDRLNEVEAFYRWIE